jgi:hypothetical protein
MLYTTLYIQITLYIDNPYHKNNLKSYNKITKELTEGAVHFII